AVAVIETSPADAAVTVQSPSGTSKDKGRTSEAQYFISQKDCHDNIALTFPVTVSAGTPADIEVWVSEGSTDCKNSASRLVDGGCTRIYPDFSTSSIKITAHQLTNAIGATDCTDPAESSAP